MVSNGLTRNLIVLSDNIFHKVYWSGKTDEQRGQSPWAKIGLENPKKPWRYGVHGVFKGFSPCSQCLRGEILDGPAFRLFVINTIFSIRMRLSHVKKYNQIFYRQQTKKYPYNNFRSKFFILVTSCLACCHFYPELRNSQICFEVDNGNLVILFWMLMDNYGNSTRICTNNNDSRTFCCILGGYFRCRILVSCHLLRYLQVVCSK